jgi:nucleotide-binding universal stress UspA family protein
MTTRIIVPLDGSESAEVVLPYIEEEIGRTGADLVLVTVRQPDDHHSELLFQSYLEKLVNNIQVNAEKYQPSPGGKPVNATWEILNGTPAEEIVAFANEEKDARIVMATHGQTGLARRALGSVAEKVSRMTSRPITLIRAQGSKPAVRERGFFNKILAPLDGSSESEITLPYIEELSLSLKADVTFMQVLQLENLIINDIGLKETEKIKAAAQEYLEKITSSLKEKGINAQYVLLDTRGTIANEINTYTARNYIDLVVMATHGRSGPSRWVLGSVAEKVLNEGNTPIMLVRTQ